MHEKKVAKKPTPTAHPMHQSNPFTTAIAGIKKLFDTNFSTLIALTLISVVIFGIVIGTALFMLVGLLAATFVYAKTYFIGLYTIYPELARFAASMNLAYVWTGWAVGAAVIIFLVSLLQAMQLKLVYESVQNRSIEFRDLLKQSLTRLLPLVGLNALLLVVVCGVLLIVFGTASNVPPMMFIALATMPVLIIAGIYIGLRLAFAQLVLVNEGLGPINALKRSWALTMRHTGEVLGVIAASGIIVILPATFLQGIARMLPTPIGSIIQLLVSITMLAIATIIMAATAQRLMQLHAILEGKVAPGKTDAWNYLAILLFMVGSMVLGALTPQPVSNKSPYYNDNQYNQDYHEYNDETLYEDNYESPDSQAPGYQMN